MMSSAEIWVTETIHGESVKGGGIEGIVDGKKVQLDVKTLRDQIPAHCFKASTPRSLLILAQDVAILASLLALAIFLQHHFTDNPWIRNAVCYGAYPLLASLPITGLWVLAHEAGHGGFSSHAWVSNTVGFVIHSSIMTPYFAWRSTHARHHQFANNVSTDLNYVPPLRDEYTELLKGKIGDLEEIVEDAPLVVFLRILLQQLIGWPWYILTHITAGPLSSVRPSKGWWDNSHFLPNSSLFRPHEFWNMVLSDIGVGGMCGLLYLLGEKYGSEAVMWSYVMPYLWVNHWIVMITYLHHTSPYLPKYTPESWTYLRGALATVDRNPGWVLRYMFHHIIDLHVIHHLFPRIPHYHAQEATEAIMPILGEYYHAEDGSYWGALWEAFTQCQWVEADPIRTLGANVYGTKTHSPEKDAAHLKSLSKTDEDGVLWYRPGRMPMPALVMRSAS